MLERFSNKDYILSTKGAVRAITWKQDDIAQMQLGTQIIYPDESPAVELHLYSGGGRYITGGGTSAFQLSGNTIAINYGDFFNSVDIQHGYYEVVSNIHRNLLGDELNQLIQVKEISPDRREIVVRLVPLTPDQVTLYGSAVANYLSTIESAFERDLAINFGKNNVIKVINQRDYSLSNVLEPDTIAFRLYQPLPAEINLTDTLWVVEVLADSYTDNVNVTITPEDNVVNLLRGPNFEFADDYNTVTETDFKTWNDLLGTNLSTSQQIIDRYFSGSLSGIQLNVDYSAFDNFIFYSSAYERLANFKYKLELLEYYNSQLSTLNIAIGTDDGALQNNVAITTNLKNNVIGSFDGFERWLYNEPTASLATHDISGSYIGAEGYALTPWPKYLLSGSYYPYLTSDPITIDWYTGFSSTASYYDIENDNALIKTIPEHIRNDANNSEYELFINMIGHHFDILYTYINSLTNTYKPEENPKLGRSREVLYNVAESLGWKLANGNQATALWKYKLGTDSSGSYQSTGSLFSKSNEDITTEVWRRIVNNLPYLLKTKGTSRSVKALMNAYGIPQTLLSIREYGGPLATNDAPSLIEDRFAYSLRLTGESQVSAHMHHVTSSNTEWGISRGIIPIMTHEIRFKPSVTQSMLLMSYTKENTTTDYVDPLYHDLGYTITNTANGSNIWHVALEHTASYSGSGNYGRVHFVMAQGSASAVTPLKATTEWAPLYDNDWWNLRLQFNTSAPHYNSGSNTDTTYHIRVQKKSDFVNAKVVHAVSASATPSTGSHYQFWCSPTPLYILNIGGSSGSISDTDDLGINGYLSASLGLNAIPRMFNGNLQEYRSWLEIVSDSAFNDHTINPTSYASGLSPSSSFDTLIRQFTFGSDTKAYDLSGINSVISSSQPYRRLTNFGSTSMPFETTASLQGFKIPANIQRGNYETVEETYYIPGTSLGGNNFYSQKIRLDDNELVRRLSPITSGERSRYDLYPVDDNKLGMFYSMADQLNKDIFNHIGRVEIDDFIGDPSDEFEYTYPDLVSFSKQYWKKFSDRNDINAYIRIFSQFDFSLFNQIKQLLPERADYVYGLLVEPHALERVKMPIYKGIGVEDDTYEIVMPTTSPTTAGDAFLDYTGIMSASAVLNNSEYISEYTGMVSASGTLYESAYIAEAVATFAMMPSGSDYCTIFTPPVDERPRDTAPLQSVYTASLGSADGWSGVGLSVLTDNTGSTYITTTGPMSHGQQSDELYSLFNVNTEYLVDYDFIFNFRLSTVLYASGSYAIRTKIIVWSDDIPLKSIVSENVSNLFISGTSANYSILHDHVSIPPNTNNVALVTTLINNTNGGSQPTIQDLNVTRIVNEVCHYGLETIIDRCRPSYVYQEPIYHYSGSSTYGNPIRRNWDHAVSQSLGLFYSESVDRACYHDDFYTNINNLYYDGCRITAPGINRPTNLPIGYMPVVEVYITNPNQLVYSGTPSSTTPTRGGGSRQPGNLIVR